MNENIRFLQAFLKNPLKVGAIAPSSPELAKKMTEDLFANENEIILELGVGTGAITKFLEEIVPNTQSYLGVELDYELVQSLKKRFPALQIIQGNASEVYSLHQKTNLGKVGYIISCLPFVSIPNKTVEIILSEIDKFMAEGCLFRTFQYAHGYYMPSAIKLREYMETRYGKAQKSELVMKNVPPAYTLTWRTV